MDILINVHKTLLLVYKLNANTYVISFHWSLRFLQYCASNNTKVQMSSETAVN